MRPIGAGLLTLVVMAAIAYAYDTRISARPGSTSGRRYWERQLGPVDIATPIDGASTLAGHAVFYSRGWCGTRRRGVSRSSSPGRATARAPVAARRRCPRAVLFALVPRLAVAILLPSSRFAERYAFAAIYAVATAGAVIAYRAWRWIRAATEALGRAYSGVPISLWFVLMIARLVLGPFLPRIS